MISHPIEVEVRGELMASDIPRVRAALLAEGFRADNFKHRTMLMSFGMVGRIAEDEQHQGMEETDIRCRITNGQAEVVVKLGGVHAHDRREVTTPIAPEALRAFARALGALNMLHKVGSRTTESFVRDGITAAIVSSKSGLAYVELEKISDEQRAAGDHEELLAFGKMIALPLWTNREAFIAFCRRLTSQDDWLFYGSEEDVERFMIEALATR